MSQEMNDDDQDVFEEISKALPKAIERLTPVVGRNCVYDTASDLLFLACLRASFAKAFELTQVSMGQTPEYSFFLASSLRGVTEDLIYLSFLASLPADESNTLIQHLVNEQVRYDVQSQRAFMDPIRPFQQTVATQSAGLEKVATKAEKIWLSHFSRKDLRRNGPSVRRIAEYTGQTFLEVLYDFMYQLTSGIVHFNPHILLRSGWGETFHDIAFSAKNMFGYYREMNKIYSAVLLCMYFEIFDDFIDVSEKERRVVAGLRYAICAQPRWPEMVTFEELNIEPLPPNDYPLRFIVALEYASIIRDEGFLKGAEEIKRKQGH